jgi:AraC-like DNA-binding protein
MGATVTPLLDAPSLRLGRFRCPPTDEDWALEQVIGPMAHVVFPERPVTITRRTTGPQLGDRNWAFLYRPGERYGRELVDPHGDECTFLELSPELYEGLRAADRAAPFDAGRVLVDDRVWLQYQDCLAGTGDLVDVDPELLERRLQQVLRDVLRRATEDLAVDGEPLPDSVVRGADRRVHDACRLLATHLDERLTLPSVAEAVGLSTYHFCRVFRATTGLTVHAYRKRLRLREAFATCAARPDRKLSEVALAMGYSSHSHMTTDFQQSLAMTPSTVRDRYARGSAEAGFFNLR